MIDHDRLPAELTALVRDGRPASPPHWYVSPTVPDVVLESRRSHRAFAAGLVPLDALRAAIAAALDADRLAWPQAGAPLSAVVLALRVDGLDAGCYRSGPEFTPAWPPVEVDELVMQREFADAAAIVVLVGRVPEELADAGGPGYRRLLVRAGAAATMLLARAGAAEMVGCLFDGLLADGLDRLPGVDNRCTRALCAVALGYPAS